MNKLLFLVLLLAVKAQAGVAPYTNEMENRFIAVEAGTSIGNSAITSAQIGNYGPGSSGLQVYRVAKAIYDVAGTGGTSAAHGLGVTIPAGSIIKRSYMVIEKAFTGSGSPTLAISCESANNILSAVSVAARGVNEFIEGVSSGASSVFKPVSANCEITATPATNDFSAGKITIWAEYLTR